MNEFDSLHIDEIAALFAVALNTSFVQAGQSLQRHPTVVSKRVAALEKRLGVRLIERTTRRVRLTETGARLVERLQRAGALITEAEEEASKGATELRGKLRLALPAAMGRLWLGPMIPEFLSLHPSITIEADYSERYVDLIGEGFDAAIRVGALADSRLVARKLAEHRRILCASPGYIERHGSPREPRDLKKHNCLGFTELTSFPDWRLSRRGITETVATRGTLTANDGETLLAAARAGVGILGAGDWLMSRDLRAGNLRRILPEWRLDAEGGVYLVQPSGKLRPARTKAFSQWISGKFRTGAPWNDLSP
jgi:DNA-binding transcriptional LysR family regulator